VLLREFGEDVLRQAQLAQPALRLLDPLPDEQVDRTAGGSAVSVS
jgi:hypothetical protein